MSHAEISVQLYSVRQSISVDLPAALERIAALGYVNVELFDFVSRADDYRRALADIGLQAPSAHAGLLGGADTGAIIDAALELGVGVLIHPHSPAEIWRSRDAVGALADDLNQVADRAASAGIAIGYHNHDWELAADFDGRPALEVFAELLDPRVVLEVDVYWAEVGGVAAPGLLARLGDRVRLLHLKDGPRTHNTKAQVAVGSGSVDIPAVLAAAPRARGVVELDDFDGDVYEALADSLRYLGSLERG